MTRRALSFGGSLGPRITVLVLAYNRRQFLAHALESVAGQDLPADQFEVVVVSNFEEPASQRVMRDHGYRSVHVDAPEVGPKIWAGLEASEGEIIAFLDDDDVWEPNKLATVARRFGENGSLGYYNHGQSVIGEDGRPPPPTFRGSPEFRRQQALAGPVRVSRSGDTEREGEAFIAANPGNNSSVSVRRSVLLHEQRFVRTVPFSIDTFLLYAALVSSSDLLAEGTALTRLRVHGINTSQVSAPSFAEYFRSYAGMMDRYLAGHSTILEMVRGRPPAVAERHATAEIAKLSHFRAVARGDESRGAVAREFLAELPRTASRDRGLELSRAMYAVSPALARAANYLAGTRRWGR